MSAETTVGRETTADGKEIGGSGTGGKGIDGSETVGGSTIAGITGLIVTVETGIGTTTTITESCSKDATGITGTKVKGY